MQSYKKIDSTAMEEIIWIYQHGGTGRRTRLKISRALARTGSTPVAGTDIEEQPRCSSSAL